MRTSEINFNPRSYKRSDHYDLDKGMDYMNFNPRSYKRSDSKRRWEKNIFYYFNPRSYKRSDRVRSPIFCKLCISIHAPTRGATIALQLKIIILTISIHAPTRGATARCLNPTATTYHFNPRSYKRSDIVVREA